MSIDNPQDLNEEHDWYRRELDKSRDSRQQLAGLLTNLRRKIEANEPDEASTGCPALLCTGQHMTPEGRYIDDETWWSMWRPILGDRLARLRVLHDEFETVLRKIERSSGTY